MTNLGGDFILTFFNIYCLYEVFFLVFYQYFFIFCNIL